MLNFENNHIFTGYLKQLMSTINLPTYKIYTNEFARHLAQTGKEDPRVIESFESLGVNRPMANVNYIKNNEICSLQYDRDKNTTYWKSRAKFNYVRDKDAVDSMRKLKSLGPIYDTKTHEHLGDFLRFIRDYYNINLMSLYNCFSNKIYSNIDFKVTIDDSYNAFMAYLVDVLNPSTVNDFREFNEFSDKFNDKKPVYHGFILDTRGGEGQSYAEYNLNKKYSKISGKIGYMLQNDNSNSEITWDAEIYADDVLIYTCPVSSKEPPTDFAIDVTGVTKLEFRAGPDNRYMESEYIGFADIKLYEKRKKTVKFDSTDPNFRIYAFPVKLFAEYTIAIDCAQGIELFCGLYNTVLDSSDKCLDLFKKTYQRIDTPMFNQPFLYDKLSYKYWTLERELTPIVKNKDKDAILLLEDPDSMSRCDLINREQDLKLFIKVPATCTSSITILEGDFRSYNDYKYLPCTNSTSNGSVTKWQYNANHSVVNFDNKVDLNSLSFKPISKLQLLTFNTGESYPFADRLIEYLSGSVISPIDGIADNIKRAQKVMNQNNNYFKIDGVWENQMQKIAYDYLMNAGPIIYDVEAGKLSDKRYGLHPRVGHRRKSCLYDILGYIDKDVEKYYASWKPDKDAEKYYANQKQRPAKVDNTIQNVDIYNGLYDI